MKQYYKEGMIELPKAEDFRPWVTYKDGSDENAWLFYHPTQFVAIREIGTDYKATLSPRYFEKALNLDEEFSLLKNRVEGRIRSKQKSGRVLWNQRIGLLMLLEEPYGIIARRGLLRSNHNGNFFKRWNDWRINKFSPQSVLQLTSMKIDDIKEFYMDLATKGYFLDPLRSWFVFQQIIARHAKRKLYGKALVAQDYYEYATMLSEFIYDLTKERMPDPDNLVDGTGGSWKKSMYGDPFDYNTNRTRKAIQDVFLEQRPTKVDIIFEGETEGKVIKIILDELYVDPSRSGFSLYNARGQGNIKMNLYARLSLDKEEEIDPFVILDNDNRSIDVINEFTNKGYVKQNMFHVWTKDFEYDNFGIKMVVNKVNDQLRKNNLKSISIRDVKQEMRINNAVLMRVVSKLVSKRNGNKYLKDVVSKPALAELLMQRRIKGIRREKKSQVGWKPKLPIEKLLKKIFNLIPRSSFA